MGWRFRRRIRLAPGLHLNVSKSGLGISAGPRGAKIGIGPRGMHRSLGLPGTGIHYREEWRPGASPRGARGDRMGSDRGAGPAPFTLTLRDDGVVVLLGPDAAPLPAQQLRRIRQEEGDRIAAFLEAECERLGGGIDGILGIHLRTPDPVLAPTHEEAHFTPAAPEPFRERSPGILGRLWAPRRERIRRENEEGRTQREAAIAEWEEAREAHRRSEILRRHRFQSALTGSPVAMEALLADRLLSLQWPRETSVSLQVRDPSVVWLDVDLPPPEEMPTQTARPAARGLRILLADKSPTRIRRDYMTHVHGVLFRLVGESFHALPTVGEVVASGYTQRLDPATGRVRDEYLVSARVTRVLWEEIDFTQLAAVDVVQAFDRFDLQRDMTKTGVFRPIEPLVEGDPEST